MKLVGLSGISGSGKTHLLQMIQRELKEYVSILSLDNYYKPLEFQQKDKNGFENFDLPTGIDSDRLLSDLSRLRSGESIELKVYQFNKPDAVEVFMKIKPASVLIIEGIFVFYFQSIFSQLDYKIFLNASHEKTLNRRLKRDSLERGISKDLIHYQWENHALPGFQKYISIYKDKVDIVIENDKNNKEAFNTLIKTLNHLILPL